MLIIYSAFYANPLTAIHRYALLLFKSSVRSNKHDFGYVILKMENHFCCVSFVNKLARSYFFFSSRRNSRTKKVPTAYIFIL